LQRADINKNSKNSKNSRKHRAPEYDSPKSGPSCLFLLSPPISPAVATHLTTYQPTTNTRTLALPLPPRRHHHTPLRSRAIFIFFPFSNSPAPLALSRSLSQRGCSCQAGFARGISGSGHRAACAHTMS